jgi:hypothetical protein
MGSGLDRLPGVIVPNRLIYTSINLGKLQKTLVSCSPLEKWVYNTMKSPT